MGSRLSQHQKRRIRQQQHQHLAGEHHGRAAVVIAHMGYEVILNTDGVLCSADWRQALGDIAVNDRVIISHDAPTQRAVIEAIFPREHTLYRPQGRKIKAVASHIDQLIIVLAAQPQWQSNLLDRYIVAAHEADITPVIIYNKTDLLDTQQQHQLQDALQPYIALGYTVIPISIARAEGLSALKACLKNKQNLICGQSGVGKSSLIQALIPDCDIWTQSLSNATGLGRHTTTNSRLYPLPDGGAVIDTPGVRGFAIHHFDKATINAGFRDIAAYSTQCRFSNCSHRHEPECAVLNALANAHISAVRYQSLQQLLEEIHK